MKNIKKLLIIGLLPLSILSYGKDGAEYVDREYFDFKNQFRHTQNKMESVDESVNPVDLVTMKLCVNDSEQVKQALEAIQHGARSEKSKTTKFDNPAQVEKAKTVCATPRYEIPVYHQDTMKKCMHAKMLFANTKEHRERAEQYLQSKL